MQSSIVSAAVAGAPRIAPDTRASASAAPCAFPRLQRSCAFSQVKPLRQMRWGVVRQGQLRVRASGAESAPQLADSEDESPPKPSPPSPSSPTPAYSATLALGALGVLETGYLTAVKLAGGSAACPTDGCETVLTSSYATLYGLPLSAFGLAAYLSVVAISAYGKSEPSGPARPGLLFLTGSMATVSAYLMFTLFTKLGGDCLYCFTSAGLSAALFGLAAAGNGGQALQKQALPLVGVVAATLVALSNGAPPPDVPQFIEFRATEVTTTSSPRALEIADRLNKVGAKFYGAFWCSHCQEQKFILGKQAYDKVSYVECYPGGWERGIAMSDGCAAADLQGFPTWVIGDQRLEGDKTLDQLERAVAKAEDAMAAPALSD